MRKTIKLFLIWRIGLLFVAFLAMKFLPFKPRFPYHDAILAKLSNYQFIWHWANFDGVHYITIAEKGYIGTGLIQAFFPLYPLLIKFFNKVLHNSLYSGLIVSNLSFLAGLYFFQKLLILEKTKDKKFTLFFLLLFPTSFYFGSLYSESLFFLLAVLSFIFINQKKWFWAAVAGGLASACRITGIFLLPALMWEWWQNNFSANKNNKNKIFILFKTIILILISISGFIIFCWYLYKNFGDPFYFAKVQSGFGASRQTDKLILFHQVVWRYLKMLFTVKKTDIIFYAIVQEFFISLVVLGILIWGWIKNFKKSYLIYGFLSFFLPTLTGNLSSMPRYVALILPLYIFLGEIKNKKLKNFILIVSGVFLAINTALFLRGFWIA